MIPIAPAAGQRPVSGSTAFLGLNQICAWSIKWFFPSKVLPKSLLARTVTSVASSQASASPVGTTATQIADRGMSNIVVLPPNFLQQIRPVSQQPLH